ncbi:MAG: electron transfer flavoprotein subunit alpha/FixB family protein [Deltaproteobacteria bacterium]|nr:MAG: electron transfer flavoprotein subunit alpha/FixB family protein [Deltaproteobacteria bacterium]
MRGKILVIVEHRAKEIREITWEILSGLKSLIDNYDMELQAVVLGHRIDSLVGELAESVAKLYYIGDEELEFYTWERYLYALIPLIEEVGPKLIIMGHTSTGMDLAPRLSAAMDSPYIPDCLNFRFDGEDLFVTRELFGGKLNSEIKAAKNKSYFLTLRPGIFTPKGEKGQQKQVKGIATAFDKKGFLTQFLGLLEPPREGIDITKADIIIGVGRGVGDREKVKVVEELAKVTGGVLAGTRPVIDSGWLPKERQVGQSGKIVKPKLYIACGISGASQHTIGMKKSEIIIAVNNDPHAPIFKVAHYGIVGDLFEILPAITSKIRSVKSPR